MSRESDYLEWIEQLFLNLKDDASDESLVEACLMLVHYHGFDPDLLPNNLYHEVMEGLRLIKEDAAALDKLEALQDLY